MTSREVLTAIFKEKECPERMGVHEWFWQDAQREWEKQGLPAGVNIFDYFDLDVREVQDLISRPFHPEDGESAELRIRLGLVQEIRALLKLHALTSVGSILCRHWSACPRSGDSLFLRGLTSVKSREGD